MWLSASRAYTPSSSVTRVAGLQPAGVSAFGTDLPFLNMVKQAGQFGTYQDTIWYTSKSGTLDTGEEQYLVLDSNGYPTSLTAGNGFSGTQQFTYVQTFLYHSSVALAPGQTYRYPPGLYRLKFTGQGTISITGDASFTLSNSTPNSYVSGTFSVSPTTSLALSITAISSGTDYPRDISVVQSAYAANFDAGAIFNPQFLALFNGVQCVRTMQWTGQDSVYKGFFSNTQVFTAGSTSATIGSAWEHAGGVYPLVMNGGQQVDATFTTGSTTVTFPALASTTTAGSYVALWPSSAWASRTQVSNVSYGYPYTVPYEICADLANALNADIWINFRIDATDSYITNALTLVDSILNPGKKIYPELSNEVWNGTYWQSFLAQAFGCQQWPTQANNFTQNRNWYGMRSAVMSELCATALGSRFSGRCIPVLAAQNGNIGTITQSMATTYWTGTIDGYTGPASAHKLEAIAVAPYWGGNPSAADAATMLAVAVPLDDFFACMTGNVGTAANGSHTYTSIPSNGWQGQAQASATGSKNSASTYGLPLIGYEGGDNFFATDSVATGWAALVTSAERDPRMGTWYRTFLNWWAANVGSTDTNIITWFDASSAIGSFGSFGLVESVMQSPQTIAPKFQAFQNFIQGN